MKPVKKQATKKQPTKKVIQKKRSPKTVDVPREDVPIPKLVQEVMATQPKSDPELENPIYKNSNALLVIALVLGWMFDNLFWKKDIGINFPIFLVLCLLGGGYWLFSNKIRPAKNSVWLLVPLLFFSVFTIIRQEPLTVFLGFTFALFSVGLFATSYMGGHWTQYGFGNYINKFFLLIGDVLTGLLLYAPRARKVQIESVTGQKSFTIWALLRGLAIALPIVACFGSLLAAGDVVFERKLDDLLNLEDLSDNIFRGILILIYAYLLAGVFIHSAWKSKDEKLNGEHIPTVKPFLGFAESTVILGSVIILFIAFVVVQFQYFFGGQANIGVDGYTYSQYARRGFNELIAVAFLSLILSIVLSTIVRREMDTQKRIFSGLNIATVALVMVILVSAYQRISLSIWWHGFSRLRLYPRIFLIWLAVLLIAVVALEVTQRQRHFTLALVFAAMGFAVSITLVNIDAAIIKHNVPRTLQGKNLNVAHLASLSDDSVPALVDEFRSSSYPEWVHEGVGAALVCYLHFDNYDDSVKDWRSFNLSQWQAHSMLQGIEREIQNYSVDAKQRWNVKVRTPHNVWYECEDYDAANDNEN
ncbi:MAG: DUF4173 domain-containing protein [Anaerolineales bacterium]|nr:DUF4173 domain-containing protein [Anaerolineales bacterium]